MRCASTRRARRSCACLAPVAETERVPVREALGRVLAEDIVPAINVPAHDNSAMDGYAVRFADLADEEAVLEEVGTALAGRPSPGSVGAGECVRVMTGAVMPRGHRHRGDPGIVKRRKASASSFRRARRRRQNVRYAGEDLKAGEAGPAAGQRAAPGRARPHRLARHRRSARCSAGCASRFSPPATSSRRSARRSRKARSTTPTATRCTACWRASA